VFLDQRLAKKVPELTIYFWVIKVLTTGMGETTSDFFVHRYNPYIVVVLGAAILAVTVIWQLWLSQYNAWVYWLAVSMVAVFGTMAFRNGCRYSLSAAECRYLPPLIASVAL
jgi:uncharacterized membrane-anchored protein